MEWLGFPGGTSGKKKIYLPVQEMQEMWVQSLGWEEPLEEVMETHSNILSWKIPWTEEPGGLQLMGLQRVRHDLVSKCDEWLLKTQQHQAIFQLSMYA